MCKQIIDNFGDHAACCTKNADLIHRHNRLRNLLDTICTEGGLSPVMEKKGILGESKTPGRRPGDVTVPLWRRGLGLAIDVAVTCPFAVSNRRGLNPVSTTPRPRSTSITTLISKTPSTSSLQWCLNPLEVLMRRASLYSASCSALLPSARARSSVSTVVELGPDFPVTSNLP